MLNQLEGKYLILKDKQHDSVIHWMTGVVLFGFEELQHNSCQFEFSFLFFIHLFICFHLLQNIDNVYLIGMFACQDYDLYMKGEGHN